MRRAHRWTTLACLTLVTGVAQATPITYEFTTPAWSSLTGQVLPPGSPDMVNSVKAALDGLSASGSFTYDSDVPLTGVINGSTVNVTNYVNAISDLSGSLGTFSFSASTGSAGIANDGYPVGSVVNPLGYVDYMQLSTSASSTGTLAGLSLANVYFFWFENDSHAPGATDFLNSSDLPATLPPFNGQLGLQFAAPNPTGNTPLLGPAAFFFNVQITPVAPVTPASVPEPGTLALLMLAGAVVVMRRRRGTQLATAAA